METFLGLFRYEFFQNAFLASLFAAISCGIIGAYIVARRIVFISGGITHASFGGVGLAYYLGLNPILGAAVFGVFSALGIQYLSDKGNVREDSAIAIWWSLGMALGIIFVALTPGYAPNLMSFLFGNIVIVSHYDLLWMGVLAIFTIGFFILFFHTILFIAFDSEFAKANKLPVRLFNSILISLVALTIVLNIKVVGIILVISLLTIPQVTASLFTKDFKKMIAGSVIFGFIGSFNGLILSYYLDIPSGASIILALVLIYLIMWIIKRGINWRVKVKLEA
ncbi:MAG: metal ABC transporter permease [Bacteroidota bacterium]|nr:metal ABC transporter permease [Bacteroidota bacterium]